MKIQFTDWKPGMRPIPFIHLLTELGKISLIESKRIKEAIVDNILVKIEIENTVVANEIVAKSLELGIECNIED